MLWLWGTIAVVLALVFVGAWFYDRRHTGGSEFGGDLMTRRHEMDARNDTRAYGGGGVGGFGGGFGDGGT
ncbi:hypothetical protein [Knoellia sp. LjRoot47]|uniref:hypothetical protein n=1 Tax=Knoellia sp. LjRoot47 TaxID=3342330 RepID=UPI003ECE8439